MDSSKGESIMEKAAIYGFEFDLETAQGCTEAQTLVSNRIAELEKKKQDFEQKLESCFYDFSQSQKDYAAKQETEDEIAHCVRLLNSLMEKHKSFTERDHYAFSKAEFERVEKRTEQLAKICLQEMPVVRPL